MSEPTAQVRSWQPLLAEAAGKSGFVWLRTEPGGRAWPAWHVWQDGAVLLVSGPGEQQLPELDGPVELVLRSKGAGTRLLTLPASASPIAADDDGWPDAARALAGQRLNSARSPAELPGHWLDCGAQLTRVVPAGAPLEQPGRYDQTSGAAPPAAGPPLTGWRPWHWRGRRRRSRRS